MSSLLAEGGGDIDAWDAQIDQFQDRVQRWTGNRCRCLAFTVDQAVELAASGEVIVANWLADGLLLSGRPLRQLLPEVGNERLRRVHRTSAGSLR